MIRDPADAIVRIATSAIGNCNHRRNVPGLLSRIAGGHADPTTVICQQESMPTALAAYEAFDRREPGRTKVTFDVSA